MGSHRASRGWRRLYIARVKKRSATRVVSARPFGAWGGGTVMATWRRPLITAAAAALVTAALSITSRGVKAQGSGPGTTKLNCEESPCDAVARGRVAFNDRNLRELGGNGRACADCHVPSEHFQLSPAVARARFEALLAKRQVNKNADDPLFRPVDADDFRVSGENASDFSNLVENGLVRVTLPLPPNVRLIERRQVNPPAKPA